MSTDRGTAAEPWGASRPWSWPGRAKLFDFGRASVGDAGEPADGEVRLIGTPADMSPE